MTTQDKILQAIKDATSQQPIGVLALINQLGIDGATLTEELEALYNAKRINRCMHTKDGITQQVIWPVAVHNVSWGKFEISKPKPAATPIRTELPKAEPAPHKAAPKPKHTTQIAILALLYRPEFAEGITLSDVRKRMGVADVIQYIQWYITNDYSLNCTVESWKGLRLNSQTAPKTHEALYNLRYPAKPSPNEKAAADLYRETVAAVQQEAVGEELPTLTPEHLADGWIEWHGGYAPPVSGGDYVQCLMRNAMTISSYGYAIDFNHTDSDYDIMAYRIREKEPEVPQADTFTEQIEIERQAAEQLTATVDEIEATVLRWATEQATTEQTPLNSQVGGDHYKKLGPYQPWEVLAHWLTPEELRGFAKGTVIAYLARERDKAGDQDIIEALHTLQLWETLKHTNAQKSA